jgi:uncharacterized protein (DUF488 family)
MRDIFTIGHASRTWEDFVGLLYRNGITLVADVRRFPGSRHAPQFNEKVMSDALADEGIAYRHLSALGGRRRARPDSRNTTWRNPSFQGYADYMETDEFHAALRELMELARESRVAIMCAETVWWRCHRSMVADALTGKDWQVWHIVDTGPPKPHRSTSPARFADGVLTYHAETKTRAANAIDS